MQEVLGSDRPDVRTGPNLKHRPTDSVLTPLAVKAEGFVQHAGWIDNLVCLLS